MKKKLSNDRLIEILQQRSAVKNFEPDRQIDFEDEQTLKEVLRLSASSYGLQPYRFIFIKNPQLRQKLKEASFGQHQITDSSFLVAFCIRTDLNPEYIKKYIQHIASITGKSIDQLEGFQNNLIKKILTKSDLEKELWASKQVYIALGNALTCVSALGMDACPMEGFDPAGYDEILGNRERKLKTVVLMAVGKAQPGGLPQKKVRWSEEDLFLEIDHLS